MISIREAIARRLGAVPYCMTHEPDEKTLEDKIRERIKASKALAEQKETAYIDKLARAIARELAVVLKEGSE